MKFNVYFLSKGTNIAEWINWGQHSTVNMLKSSHALARSGANPQHQATDDDHLCSSLEGFRLVSTQPHCVSVSLTQNNNFHYPSEEVKVLLLTSGDRTNNLRREYTLAIIHLCLPASEAFSGRRNLPSKDIWPQHKSGIKWDFPHSITQMTVNAPRLGADIGQQTKLPLWVSLGCRDGTQTNDKPKLLFCSSSSWWISSLFHLWAPVWWTKAQTPVTHCELRRVVSQSFLFLNPDKIEMT